MGLFTRGLFTRCMMHDAHHLGCTQASPLKRIELHCALHTRAMMTTPTSHPDIGEFLNPETGLRSLDGFPSLTDEQYIGLFNVSL